MRFPRRVARAAPLVLVAATTGVATATGCVVADPARLARPLVRRDSPPTTVDAVFVFSGDVDFVRTRHAARVFHDLHARWFITSGAGIGGDDGAWILSVARGEGVSADAVLGEYSATTTRENVLFSREILAAHDVASIAVVTSPFHSRRAAAAAERAWRGVRVYSMPAPPPDTDCSEERWPETARCVEVVAAEWRKLLGYAVRGWL